jgi:hypothetical protein
MSFLQHAKVPTVALELLQKFIKYPSEQIKWKRAFLEYCLPSAVFIPMKVYQIIPLSARSTVFL